MNRVGQSVAIHAEVIEIEGLHANGGFIRVEAGRERAKLPDAGNYANGENNGKKQNRFPFDDEFGEIAGSGIHVYEESLKNLLYHP